jgi:hypothetical protein
MSKHVKLTSDKGPMAQRIADRLKNSGEGAGPDVTVTKGSGPTRTHTNIHHGAGQRGPMHGPPDDGPLPPKGSGR